MEAWKRKKTRKKKKGKRVREKTWENEQFVWFQIKEKKIQKENGN